MSHDHHHPHAVHESHDAPLTFHRLAPPEVNRRHAMTLMAASVALATGACSRQPTELIHPWVNMPEARNEGSPLYYASAWVRDGYAMGVLVGTQAGRPIKIEGNPLHPSSLGATDVFAQASVLELWDPDRSAAVMQRMRGSRDPAENQAAAVSQGASSWQAFESSWRQIERTLRADKRKSLRILTGAVTSPTLRSQVSALLKQYPGARWHQHSPLDDAAERVGGIEAFGSNVQSVLHLDRASCIVTLGADPFSNGPGAVRHVADWAARRTSAGPAATFAVEISPGLFGERADHRVALAPGQIDEFVSRMASVILSGAVFLPPDHATHAFERQLVSALQHAGSGALIIPGAGLSARTHALVHAMHERLGATGKTIDLIAPLTPAVDADSLADLVRDMNAGLVGAIFIMDTNPVYSAAGAMKFSEALAQVPFRVHSGLYRDETGHLCDWHLPLSHNYEHWSDALAHDGTACIVQPAIAPLYDSRSLHELVAILVDDNDRDGYSLVRRYWQAERPEAFDSFWAESLRTGFIPGTASAPARLPTVRAIPAYATASRPGIDDSKDTLDILFTADPAASDGRYANNGWLQELPRPMTKLTWDNAALVGPSTARSLNVTTGDMVRIASDGYEIEAPVWILKSHAEGVLSLPLGYGRQYAGRIGDGIGFNACPLMPVNALSTRARVTALGKKHSFAVTQHVIDQSERKLARTVEEGEQVEDDAPRSSLYPARSYPEHAWGMTIDLDACIGCNACTIACQAENNIPVVGKDQVIAGRDMHWIRVDRYEQQPDDSEGSIFQPVPCMHCENAPCEVVCPVGATVHDSEGLNVQVYNRCIGTRFCSNNCPYKVRRFNFLQYSDEKNESVKAQKNPNVTVRQRGVMEKCTYCVQRITRARQHSERTGTPLADGDVVTACQSVCPSSAIRFGDLNDPLSAVNKTRESERHYALLGELNTRPRTTYLARVRPSKSKPENT